MKGGLPRNTAGIVLAAGGGRRFGSPKAPYKYLGERLVDRSVRLFSEAGVVEIYVILGAWIGTVPGSKTVHNIDWESGQSTSLALGIRSLPDTVDRACILLVDQIGMTTLGIVRVLESPAEIAAGEIDGVITPPICIRRPHFAELLSHLTGDEGAKPFLRRNAERVHKVDLSHVASITDLDFLPEN